MAWCPADRCSEKRKELMTRTPGKIMIFANGIPLKREGKVVGAIGVSGGSGDQDHAVATAGAAAF